MTLLFLIMTTLSSSGFSLLIELLAKNFKFKDMKPFNCPFCTGFWYGFLWCFYGVYLLELDPILLSMLPLITGMNSYFVLSILDKQDL